MSDLQQSIRHVLALTDAATPPPWIAKRGGLTPALYLTSPHRRTGVRLWCDADARAVVALRTYAPPLLRVLAALYRVRKLEQVDLLNWHHRGAGTSGLTIAARRELVAASREVERG